MIEAGRRPPGIPYAGNADPAARFHERMAAFGSALTLARADEVIE
jgi:hypothetical protein